MNKRQKLFCEEYVKDFNGARAARDAGYAVSSAAQTAEEIMRNPDVKRYIAELSESRFKDVQINAGELLREIYSMAMVNPADAYGDDGELLSIPDMPPAVAKMIASFDVYEVKDGKGKDAKVIGVTKKVKFYDRSKALDMLAKHLSLYVERIEHTHTVDLPTLVLGAIDMGKEKIDNPKDVTPEIQQGDVVHVKEDSSE